MQEPAHTPLPWRITEPNEKKSREIVGANGATIARLTALDMPNAELIVKAVNLYQWMNGASPPDLSLEAATIDALSQAFSIAQPGEPK